MTKTYGPKATRLIGGSSRWSDDSYQVSQSVSIDVTGVILVFLNTMTTHRRDDNNIGYTYFAHESQLGINLYNNLVEPANARTSNYGKSLRIKCPRYLYSKRKYPPARTYSFWSIYICRYILDDIQIYEAKYPNIYGKSLTTKCPRCFYSKRNYPLPKNINLSPQISTAMTSKCMKPNIYLWYVCTQFWKPLHIHARQLRLWQRASEERQWHWHCSWWGFWQLFDKSERVTA